MRLQMILPFAIGVVIAACSAGAPPDTTPPPVTPPPTAVPTASPNPSPGFALRRLPDGVTPGCDAIGIDYQSLTWQIDPASAEAVTALTDTGVTLHTAWASGFTAGTADERVIRDPGGVIVVRDGDRLQVGDRLGGYWVCLGPDSLSVFTEAPQ